MEEISKLKNKIESIIEHSDANTKVCRNCKSYSDGMCMFCKVNERIGGKYNFSNGKVTTPEYSCENFDSMYKISERTVETLINVIRDIDRVNEASKNIELLLSGKISEEDFNEILG